MIHNTDRNRGCKHLTLLVVAISAISVVVGSARAEDPVADEIGRVTVVNRALFEVCGALLARNQWKLDQLKLLRDRGHASWREVARQQVAVKSLEVHRDAAGQFAGFLEALGRQVEQNGDRRADRQPPTTAADFTPPIKLTLPGSIRLIAWFESDLLPVEAVAEYEVSGDASAPDLGEFQRELDAEGQKVADAEARVRGLTRIADKPGIADELKRAELDLAVAVAEFEWHEARLQWQHSRSERATLRQQTLGANHQPDREYRAADAGATPAAIPAMAADLSFINHTSSATLHDATLRVAAAEAEAIGELRAAEVALRRNRLRLDAMQQLHAKGFASQRELDHAHRDVSTAKSLVGQLTARRKSLAQSYETLRAGSPNSGGQRLMSSSGEPPDPTSDSASDQIQPEMLPEMFLDHVWAVEHLIDLRQRRFAASARRRAITAETKMLEDLHRKLERTGLSGESIRRELENLRIDIEYQQALALAEKERLAALRLEEVRFVRQILEQVQAGTNDAPDTDVPSVQSTRVAEADSEKSNEDVQFVALAAPWNHRAGGWPRLHYLESLAISEDLTLCDSVQLSFGIPVFSVWDSPYRSRRRRSAVFASRHIDCADDGPLLFSQSAPRRICDDALLDGPTLASVHDLWRDRLRYRNPSYLDYYAFGKRRSDRRPPRARYWSYGTPPWYLPGYPTNFR